MADWTNPYKELQHAVRTALRDRLRRTNGCVTREEFLACAVPERIDRAEKLMLRLLRPGIDGRLEWKPEIVSEDLLVQKVGRSAAINERDLISLWSRSRHLHERTAFPYLAPAGDKSKLVSRHSFNAAPVFGVDLLVRPPVAFSEDRLGGQTRNALTLGDESIAVIVHGGFHEGRLDPNEEYFVRLVVGDDLAIPKVQSRISATAGGCELAMLEPLLAGDAPGAVGATLPRLDRFAREVATDLLF